MTVTNTPQQRFHKALQDLLTHRQFNQVETAEALEFFCQTLCRELKVARAGIWRLNQEKTQITPLAFWDAENPHAMPPGNLGMEDARSYFEAITQDHIVAVNDVSTDARCVELNKAYLPANNIVSMLDTPIHTFGGLAGVICAEHTQTKRVWDTEEIGFALAVSGLVSLTLEHEERVKAERSAARNKDRLRLYTELAADWFWETDSDMVFTHVHGPDSLDGQLPEDYVGHKVWDMPPLSPLEGTWDDLKNRIAERKKIYSFVVSADVGRERRRYAELTGIPKIGETGEFDGYWGTAKDVTSRVEKELELAASEQKYRNASRLAKLGSWVWDQKEGRCSYCSPELAEIYGVSVDEYLQRTQSHERDMEWFHPEDRDHYEKVVLEASDQGVGYEVTARIVRDDGSVRVLHEITEPVFDSNGAFVATSGVLLDITEEEELRRTLADEKERLINIVNNIPGAVYRLKLDGKYSVIYRSAGFFREFVDENSTQTGFLSNEENARSLDIPEPHKARVEQLMQEAHDSGTPYEFEYPVLLDDGTEKWVWDRGRTHEMPDGSVEIEGILIDATAKQHAQEALVHAQKIEALGKLTSGVAHDFNNLLAIILGNLEIIREDNADQSLTDYISKGVGATLRARELTSNLLSFARKAPLKPSVLELNEIVERVQGWLERTLPRNVDLQSNVASDLWPIQVDESSTENALLNLIINARDAMQDGGSLVIEARNVVIEDGVVDVAQEPVEGGRYVQLLVRDTGTGIEPDVLEKIFDPFFTTKAATEGSGLGLSSVLGFVKQSGGFMKVQTKSGQGTTFCIYFRASDAGSEANDADALAPRECKLAGVKALLVDDEPDVLTLLKRFVESADMIGVTARSGGEALSIFESDPSFDLLLTDIVMPGPIQGHDLAKACRSLKPDLPVVFLSGYANEDLVEGRGLRHGDVRLDKPMKQSELLNTLRSVMKIAT